MLEKHHLKSKDMFKRNNKNLWSRKTTILLPNCFSYELLSCIPSLNFLNFCKRFFGVYNHSSDSCSRVLLKGHRLTSSLENFHRNGSMLHGLDLVYYGKKCFNKASVLANNVFLRYLIQETAFSIKNQIC